MIKQNFDAFVLHFQTMSTTSLLQEIAAAAPPERWEIGKHVIVCGETTGEVKINKRIKKKKKVFKGGLTVQIVIWNRVGCMWQPEAFWLLGICKPLKVTTYKQGL